MKNNNNDTSIQDFFAATSGCMNSTQQMNFLFSLKNNLPALQQQLADLDNPQR